MKRIITIISAATTVLAFYNEARRAGLIKAHRNQASLINTLEKGG